MAVCCAGVSEIVVKISFFPRGDEAVEIPPGLLIPSVDEVLGIDLDRLDLADCGESNDDPANHDSVARYSVMLEGPTIAQELGSEVPFFCPIMFQALSSFFISNDGALVPSAKHIESTNVDKGITRDRVHREVRHPQWDAETPFK